MVGGAAAAASSRPAAVGALADAHGCDNIGDGGDGNKVRWQMASAAADEKKSSAAAAAPLTDNNEGTGSAGMAFASFDGKFSMSWRVEWSGTFPVAKVSADSVAKRLDALLGVGPQPSGRLAGTRALLTISPQGVEATAVDNAKLQFLSHPIRKVCHVLGRVQTRQLAYITREQPSHSGHHIPYRKQCHVFRTETAFEVEEIESVLSSAFQKALSLQQQPFPPMETSSPSPKLRLTSASVRDVATSPLFSPSPMKTPKKERIGGFLERSRSQMRISFSCLIQKIFGTPKKQQQQQSPNAVRQSPHNGGGIATPASGVRFRKPRWPLAPLRSCASSATPKRPPTTEYASHCQPPFPPTPQQYRTIDSQQNSAQQSHQLPQFALPHGTQNRFSSNSTHRLAENYQRGFGTNDNANAFMASASPADSGESAQAELVYDERLKEWIFPLDQAMLGDLQRLAYFCGQNEKDLVLAQLRRLPVGHFVIRPSGSRRKCLALTVRVLESPTNPKGIAHYLVLRNEHGFRIRGSKRYFPSLPMLITHHSVLPEQLPCRLQLSDWRWTREPQMTRRRQSSGGSTLAALRARDESGGCPPMADPCTMIRWRAPANANGTNNHWPGPRGTSSTLFSSKSSTILSA